MPLEFAQLTRTKLDALPKGNTVFFFGVGPFEDHGPHLPLGMDLSEATWMCRAAAERLETEKAGWVGVLMPPIPAGIDSDTTEVALTVRPHVLRDWLVDCCRGLKARGFTHFVCFSGHLGPRQLTAIEEAGKLLNRRGIYSLVSPRFARARFVSASSAWVPPREVRRSPFWPDALEHGGARDTSVAITMGVHPELDPGTLPEVKRMDRWFDRVLKRALGKAGGYWGAPARATPEQGQRELQERLGDIFPKLRAVWEGSDPNMMFRSYYSVLPPNWSFFKAWLLFGCVLAIMLVWMFLTFPQALV
jgi:creatinine amidohydrolase